MPIQITFEVVAAPVLGGSISSAPVTYPGDYATIYWELVIPVTAEYEDTDNQITSVLVVDGEDVGTSVWPGGHVDADTGTNHPHPENPSPKVQFSLDGYLAGQSIAVRFDLAKSMTVGIGNGLIS